MTTCVSDAEIEIRVAAKLFAGIFFAKVVQRRNITRLHSLVTANCGAVLIILGVGWDGADAKGKGRGTAALDRCFVVPDGDSPQA